MYAQQWADIAIKVIQRAYPYSSGHLARGPQDTDITPQRLHPAFWGSLDWHSSVHMQWSLVQLVTGYSGDLTPQTRAAAVDLLVTRLSAENLSAEVAYLERYPSFERPYGWAWAAQLAAALEHCDVAQLEPARAAMQPVSAHIAAAVQAWLPRQAYPVRHGKHQNDAFALTLLLDAFSRLGHQDVCAAIRQRARDWFGGDKDYQTAFEPSGSDFLSPALSEAGLMRVVMEPTEFAGWIETFLPGWSTGGHPQLLAVPRVLDSSDGQFVHLRGLALSRSWQLSALVPFAARADQEPIVAAAQQHVDSALPDITEGDFMATHWLVSFALLASDGLAWRWPN